MSLRIVVAEDEVLLRESLASLFESLGFEVVGKAGDADGLLALVDELRPDLAVVDIRMPPTHSTEGIEAARAVRAGHPETGVLVLSAHVEVEEALELLSSGDGIGVGYLLKASISDIDDFAAACERIAKGGTVIDQSLVQQLVSRRRRDDPLAHVTPREREVLALMAEGRSNAGIARRLWVTEGTVEKHVGSILTKLGITATDADHRRVLAVLKYLEAN